MIDQTPHDILRATLEKQLQAATSPWERLPLLIELSKNPNDHAHAYQCAQEAYRLAKELNDPFWIACSLRAIANDSTRHGRHTDAITHLRKASEIFGEINDFRRKAEIDLRMARSMVLAGEYAEGMKLLLSLVDTFNSLQDRSSLAHVYVAMGDIHRVTGNHTQGLRCFRKGLALGLKYGTPSEIGRFYASLAVAYRMLEDNARYRLYMFKSLAVQRKAGNLSGIATALANIAMSYIEDERFAEAEKYVLQSGKLYRKLGHVIYEANAWGKLGRIYQDKGELEKAYRCHRKAISLAQNSDHTFLLALLYESFGGFCMSTGCHRRGIFYLKKGVALLENHTDTYHKYRAYEYLAHAYEEIGDTVKALEAYKEYGRIKEEYINNQKYLEANRAEMTLRIKTLRKRLREERTVNDNLKRKVEEQEAQLVTMTLNLIKEGEEMQKKKRAINCVVEENVASGNWEIFARNFHKVHHDFYFKLVKEYPHLTPTEIKVCSLIRIGLSSKEIGDLLCISVRTVDRHREEIRKRLQLPPRFPLVKFITGL